VYRICKWLKSKFTSHSWIEFKLFFENFSHKKFTSRLRSFKKISLIASNNYFCEAHVGNAIIYEPIMW
jgi:hypothetical protein